MMLRSVTDQLYKEKNNASGRIWAERGISFRALAIKFFLSLYLANGLALAWSPVLNASRGCSFPLSVHQKNEVESSINFSDRNEHCKDIQSNGRRAMMSFIASSFLSIPARSFADDEDMTSQLFNPDGSLKEDNNLGVTGKLSFKTVSAPLSDATDGEGASLMAYYNLPSQWKDDFVVLYPDGTESRACESITVFQKPGSASISELEKASMVGVGKTLGLSDKRFLKADLIGGRKREDGDTQYFDFDIAVAPPTCTSNDKENLGLGFCPYDSIVLLSATVTKDAKMCVFSLECNKDEWKRSNSDLKLIRSSFKVEA